jgi:L-malate glycosyltransferase
MARRASSAVRWILRGGMAVYVAALHGLGRMRAGRSMRDGGSQDILLTLHFHAPGWGQALLGPLSRARHCRRLRVVTTAAVPDHGMAGVEVIEPPRWLIVSVGSTGARLLTFAWVAVRTRPDVVGGVHLLFNGLLAAVLARMIGARSMYVCVGGPNEVIGGGLYSENRVFSRLGAPDAHLEARLLEAVRQFDLVVTMGTRAATFYERRGIRSPCHVIPCGVELVSGPPAAERDVDLVLVARLVPLKRLDLFVRTVAELAPAAPSLSAVVIGEGPMREAAEALARQLGVARHVRFLGRQSQVWPWLQRAKVFLLPSDTEGVSISLLEAMACGVVPVVSDVGDLADAVVDGTSGFLVGERSPRAFARPILDVLARPELRTRLSASARESASRFHPGAMARRWDLALGGSVDRLDGRALQEAH